MSYILSLETNDKSRRQKTIENDRKKDYRPNDCGAHISIIIELLLRLLYVRVPFKNVDKNIPLHGLFCIRGVGGQRACIQ